MRYHSNIVKVGTVPQVVISLRSGLSLFLLLFLTLFFFSCYAAELEPTQLPVVTDKGTVDVTANPAENSQTWTATQPASVMTLSNGDVGSNATLNVNMQDGWRLLAKVNSGSSTYWNGKVNCPFGTFVFENQAGLNIGRDAHINVNNFIATTLEVNTNSFINGNYEFIRCADKAFAEIANHGAITGNNIALIGSSVKNTGVIVARIGAVHLAAGDKTTVSFDRRGLIQVEVNERVSGSILRPDGTPVKEKDAIMNSGTIEAGAVYMSVKTAGDVFENAVNHTTAGIIKTTGMIEDGGVIKIVANGNVKINGTLEAKCKDNIEIDTPGVLELTGPVSAESGTVIIGAVTPPSEIVGKIGTVPGEESPQGGDCPIFPISASSISLIAGAFNNIVTNSPDVSFYKKGGDLIITASHEEDGFVTLAGDGLNVTYLKSSNVTFKTDGAAGTANSAIIAAQNLTLIANKFGTSATPVNVDAENLTLRKVNGEINILDMVGIGSSIFMTGPPEEDSLNISYNNTAKLFLDAPTISIVGSEPTHLLGNITFSNLSIIIPGKIVYFESALLENPLPNTHYTLPQFTILGTLTIRGAPGNHVVLCPIPSSSSEQGSGDTTLSSSSEPGLTTQASREATPFHIYINAVSDGQGHPYLEYVTVHDSVASGPAAPIQARAGTILKVNAPGWDATYYWLGTTSTSWNTAANWSLSSGGPADGAVPTSTDDVIFDGGSVLNCTLDVAMDIVSLTVEAGYTGTLDLADSSYSHAVSGNVTLSHGAAGTVDLGNSTLTVGGNFDWSAAAGTVTMGTSTLVMTGAGKELKAPYSSSPARFLYALTIQTGATITTPNTVGMHLVYDLLTLNGTWTVNNTGTIQIGGAGIGITQGASGVMSGTSTLYLYPATYTFANPSAIAPATIWVQRNVSLPAGTYSPTTLFRILSNNPGDATFTWQAGTYTFTSPFQMDQSGSATGTWTISGANNPTLIFQSDVTVTQTTGTISFSPNSTNPNQLTGTAAQVINLAGKDMGAWVINKPTSGAVTFTSGDTITAGGAWTIGTQGLTEPAGVSIDLGDGSYEHSVTGDVTLDGTAFDMGNSTLTVGGNFDFKDVTTWTKGTSSLIFNKAGSQTLTAKSTRTLYAVTINAGSTVVVSTNSAGSESLTVNGILSINTGKLYEVIKMTTGTGQTILGASSQITGLGQFEHLAVAAGNTLTRGSGDLIDVATFTYDYGTAPLPAGTYSSASTVLQSASTAGYATAMSGSFIFLHDFTISLTAAGTFTINNINNPSFEVRGNYTFTNSGGGTLTYTKGTGTITLSGSGAQAFNGLGNDFESMTIETRTGDVTITGSNTFTALTINAPNTVIFTAGTTTTVGSFSATGTAGNIITITTESAGSFASLVKTGSGIVSCDYLSVKDSHVTPDTFTWYAGANSTSVSGNDGWIFTIPINTWSSAGSTSWNTSGNWSAGRVPVAEDNVTFDATSVVNCTLDVAMDITALTVEAGYTGTLDLADSAYAHAVSGNVTLSHGAAGTVDLGNSTLTVGGNFDWSAATGTVTRGTSTLVMTGTGKELKAPYYGGGPIRSLYNLTIAEGASITTPNTVSSFDMYGTTTVNGALTINNTGNFLTEGSAFIQGANGTVAGTGTLYWYAGAITLNGVISSIAPANIIMVAGLTLPVGTYSPATNFTITGTSGTQTWSAGIYTFTSSLTFSGTFTVSGVNNPTLIFQSNLTAAATTTFSDNSTNPNQLTGTAAQVINLAGKDMGTWVINKPTSGAVTFTSGDTITAGGAWTLGSQGLTEPAGVSMDLGDGSYEHSVDGDVTLDGTAFDMGNSTLTVGGSFDNKDVTTWTLGTATLVMTGTG
ncbi:MAG: hypothetical protein WC592_08610, partial [Candidatus Omnitrophota bacterium]